MKSDWSISAVGDESGWCGCAENVNNRMAMESTGFKYFLSHDNFRERSNLSVLEQQPATFVPRAVPFYCCKS